MTCTVMPWHSRSGHLFDLARREIDDFVHRLSDADVCSDEVASFSPRTNVAETDQQYEITLDLPGMTAEDFSLELHEGRLSITGERQKEDEQEGKTFHRVERFHGKFRRSFKLGPDVDSETVSAEYKDGVLAVTVPKTEKAQPRKIQVNS